MRPHTHKKNNPVQTDRERNFFCSSSNKTWRIGKISLSARERGARDKCKLFNPRYIFTLRLLIKYIEITSSKGTMWLSLPGWSGCEWNQFKFGRFIMRRLEAAGRIGRPLHPYMILTFETAPLERDSLRPFMQHAANVDTVRDFCSLDLKRGEENAFTSTIFALGCFQGNHTTL